MGRGFHILAAAFLLSVLVLCGGGAGGALAPGKSDKCPVCGMFVHKYPDFLAQIKFNDGKVFFFDGNKDMFRFFFNLKKYAPERKTDDISSIHVTDYYSLSPVDGREAYYVAGSDVHGPMGKELIPFGKEPEAREFMKDHKGKSLLKFKDINPSVLKELE
ncbi:MAG TPA: nitrous oxide reductase accessory protein NosL [Lentisphaeria bacterium]|nr:MAG: nitrous oxide reductase accessory protein NosL [Lentisphaerae bacterium GWF2_50_93]HCE44934.1 nitrous oxide reductase accessory protein NosL [Lentisphaeria bacterium]